MRPTTEDVRELMADVEQLRKTDWSGINLNGLATHFGVVLDTVVNCLRNSNNRIEELEEEVKRLRRAQ